MKRLSSFLILVCFATACKKKEVQQPAPTAEFDYIFNYTIQGQLYPNRGELQILSGDTSYIRSEILLKHGTGRMVTLQGSTDIPGLHIYLSQDKGIPPFRPIIMVVADGNLPDTGGAVDIRILDDQQANSYVHILAFVNKKLPDTAANCAISKLGTYNVYNPPFHYLAFVDSVPNVKNAVLIRNIDSLGDSAVAYTSCQDDNFSIPLQRLNAEYFISGGGTFGMQLFFTVTDYSGNVKDYTYGFAK